MRLEIPEPAWTERLQVIYFILGALLVAGCAANQSEPDWTMGPFLKINESNPVLTPLEYSVFVCPVRGSEVRWESKDVFNPAAVVKDDKIYLLYRAEDTVGRHAGTSRIGLAESTDGINFNRRPEPVLFPHEDAYID